MFGLCFRQKGSGLTSIMVGGAKESLFVSDGDKISVILRVVLIYASSKLFSVFNQYFPKDLCANGFT